MPARANRLQPETRRKRRIFLKHEWEEIKKKQGAGEYGWQKISL